MTTLSQIRSDAEADLTGTLEKLDARHKKLLAAALKKYGSVRAIPEDVWRQIVRETEEETVLALLLLITLADDWTTGEIQSQTDKRLPRLNRRGQAQYGVEAARRANRMAEQTVNTMRQRLDRSVQDAQLGRGGGLGDVGELTQEGIDKALEDILNQKRRESIVVNETTGAISAGQRGAGARAGQVVTVELIWKTEGDSLVCPRCSPLDGKNEDVWGLVFRDGPGEEAHPNCRCELLPRVIVEAGLKEHYGPGNHPNGSPQSVHGGGGGGKQTDTKEFKAWFGDSKVVDDKGEPLRVYHGTVTTFDSFDPESQGSNIDHGKLGSGHYFSEDPQLAGSYAMLARAKADRAEQVMPVYLSVQNPLVIDTGPTDRGKDLWDKLRSFSGELGIDDDPVADRDNNTPNREWAPKFTSKLRQYGYDGVVVEFGRGRREWMVFAPEQIKSATGNRGTFDPKSKNITEALAR